MANDSIFADEWRDCLRAHYTSVIRNDDQITLRSLVGVMHEVGFSDEELRDLAFHATLRAEDMPDDFVPDMEILTGAQPVAKPEPPVEPAAEPEAELVPPEYQSSDDLGMTLEETLAVVNAAIAEEEAPLDPEDDTPVAEDADTPDDGDVPDAEDAGDEPPKSVPGITQLSLF